MLGSTGQLSRCTRLLGVLAAAWLWHAQGQAEDKAWSERETRLANEYLSLLVQQPEYGRVLDLLWTLYEKHDATRLLVENVSQQAAASNFPAVKLVEAHLVRKSGDLKKAAQLYDALLARDAANLTLLEARAAVAREMADTATALTLLRKAAELAPATDAHAPRLWIELGSMALTAGKNAEAVDAYERAAKLRPQDIDLAREVAQLLLQAGSPERAAAFFTQLATQKDPQQRLDALHELARIYELADQFTKADQALKEGLALLHFRDGRYLEFFRRRVRLHERFGALESLRKELLTAAQAIPPAEQALLNASRFFELTVEADEQIHWLRELVKVMPQAEDYRWELVRVLLDHEGTAEAARLLDERLKNDGTDLPALVLLRCEADLRSSSPQRAVERLLRLLKSQLSTDVEKQVLTFAQTRSLDAVVEQILRSRVARDPHKAEAVFDLAAFFRARRDLAAEDRLLRAFTDSAATEDERQRRLADAATFLAASNNLDSAIILARESVARPGAGREAWIRLAELLAEQGEGEEAAQWVDKAWHASRNDEERVDVDERLLSILAGDQKPPAKDATEGDFKLPDAFTGAGFGSGDAPDGPKRDKPAENVLEFARKTIASARKAGARTEDLFRGFWWALRTHQLAEAYELLGKLQFDPITQALRPISLTTEQLKLDLAQEDENTALAERQLRHLSEIDSSGRVRYTLRLAESLLESERRAEAESSSPGWKSDTPFARPGVAAAQLLERVYHENPESGQLLSALTKVYFLQRRVDDALALWRRAIQRVDGSAAQPLLESFAEILLQQHRLAEHVEIQVRILENETDVKRRREQLRRCIDRLTFSDTAGGELALSVARDRLKLLERALLECSRRHPFDGFFHEALAQVYERGGEPARAFASMRQAYYTAPETPFSLDQLRDAALKVSDLKSAIYFQKQIAAAARPKDIAAETRRLVEMLEQTFQIAEADRVRRHLESRFAQDAPALEELAGYYHSTGQDEAERRVYEQMARVRAWDGRAHLRLALKCLRFVDEAEAEKHLQAVLATPVKQDAHTSTVGIRSPLPLTNTRRSGGVTTGDLAPLLDFAPGLERKELDQLRAFLGQPRAEFTELPDDAAIVRLRAIEELAKLRRAHGGEALAAWIKQWRDDRKVSAVEKLWALYYAGAGVEFRAVLKQVLPETKALEEQFCFVWLSLRSHGMQEVVTWAGEKGWSAEVTKSRAELLQACASMLCDVADFRYHSDDLQVLGESRVLRNPALLELTRKLQDKQRYDEALALGGCLPRLAPEMEADYSLFLAPIAESAERWDLARRYLEAALRGPVAAGNYRTTYDPFLLSLVSLSRMANSAQQREEALRQAWRRLQSTRPSAMTAIRRAAVAGLAGADAKAAGTLGNFLSGPFVAQREMHDVKGNLLPQGSSRYEEPMHLRSYWEETREIEALLTQQGLSAVVSGANATLAAHHGASMLSPRSDSEFGEWRINELLNRLRYVDHPTRLRLIREHLASVDLRTEHSVDTLGNLGSRLESAGMARAAIGVYRQLPSRAPSNPEYAQWVLRSTETAMEIEPGLSFVLQLLLAEPPMKPPQPSDDTLREKHAMFLAWDFNVDELRRRGFREPFSQVLERRRPHEVSYLRELGLLQERMHDDKAALSAWDRLHAAYVANDQLGTDLDIEAALHRGQILHRLNQPTAALKILRDVPLAEPLDPTAQEVLKLRCELAAAASDAGEVRALMTLCVERKPLPCVVALGAGLRAQKRTTEALNLLTQAERTLHGDHERFTLRLEQLKVLDADAAWTPQRGRAQIAALFRTTTRDPATLKDMHAWLSERAHGPHATGWAAILRTEARAGADRPLAALALSAFTSLLPATAHEDFMTAWQQAEEKDRQCIELAAAEMLKQNRATWAWDACQVIARIPTLREQGRKIPLTVRVAHALGDNAAVRELFNETLRLPFPGGVQTVEWARAFEETGHLEFARELLDVATQRLDDTSTLQPELFAEQARFLIRRQAYEAAETLLIRRNWAMPALTAKLIFELYQSWGRLAGIEAELPKFHLPGAVLKETLFLARQATTQSVRP